MELEDDDDFMPLTFFNEEVIPSNTVTYFVKSFSEFSQKLKEHELCTNSKFVLAHSLKKFSAENVSIRENSKLRWKDDIPYYHVCTRTYTCHQGRDGNIYQKMKYAEQRDAKALTDHNFTKRYNRVYTTKKLDCPAVVNVSRIVWIPEHKLMGNLTKTFEKKKVSRTIKSKISRGEPVGEECFMFNLPDETDHKYHSVGTDVELIEPCDFEMSDYIEFGKADKHNALIPPNVSEVYLEATEHQYESPNLRVKRNKLLNSCKSYILSIQSTMSKLDEDKLEKLSKTLDDLFMDITRERTTEKTAELSIETNTTTSSSEDNDIFQEQLSLEEESPEQESMDQKSNVRGVVEADTIANSEDSEIDEESAIGTNSVKRKQKTPMILIKKKKFNPQISLINDHPISAISIPTKRSFIISTVRHQMPSF